MSTPVGPPEPSASSMGGSSPPTWARGRTHRSGSRIAAGRGLGTSHLALRPNESFTTHLLGGSFHGGVFHGARVDSARRPLVAGGAQAAATPGARRAEIRRCRGGREVFPASHLARWHAS